MAKELKKNNMARNTSLKGMVQSKRTRKSPLRFGWGGWGGGRGWSSMLKDHLAGNTLQSSVQTSAPAGTGSYVSTGRGLQDLISGNTLQ